MSPPKWYSEIHPKWYSDKTCKMVFVRNTVPTVDRRTDANHFTTENTNDSTSESYPRNSHAERKEKNLVDQVRGTDHTGALE
jgi:hypothetical protein